MTLNVVVVERGLVRLVVVKKEIYPGVEPGLQDSKSGVIAITLIDQIYTLATPI